MDAIDSNELWRFIPPEEKIMLLTKAQTTGVSSSLIAILIGATIAVGIQEIWIFWGSMIICPLFYQLTAGRAWRGHRPRIMLEYLAARSAARRYAFSANSKDLTIDLLFRGSMREDFVNEDLNQALEGSIFGNRESAVWIALFTDAIVVMEEKPGGASLRMSHLINDKLSISANSEGYESDLEITLQSVDKRMDGKRITLTSEYPAALTVFLKKSKEFKEAYRMRINGISKALPDADLLSSPEDGETDIFARLSY